MNANDIAAQVEELKAKLEAARKEESAAALAAWKELPMEYVYTVDWVHPAQFRIERQVTAETQARIDEHKLAYPVCALEYKPFAGGMTYSLLEGGYVISGGGSVIVDWQADGYSSSFDPTPIKPEWIAALRQGIVPEEIKRP